MQIITRSEAKALGLKRYFTGKPCKHGHMSERKVCDSRCLTCGNLSFRRYRRTDQYREWHRRYGAANHKKRLAKDREARTNNPEKFRARWRRCRLKTGIQLDALRELGLITKHDTTERQRALLAAYKDLGILNIGDIPQWN